MATQAREPDPETAEKATRRRFTPAYKRKILARTDQAVADEPAVHAAADAGPDHAKDRATIMYDLWPYHDMAPHAGDAFLAALGDDVRGAELMRERDPVRQRPHCSSRDDSPRA